MANSRCFTTSVYDNFFIFLNMDFFDISRYQRLTGSELHAKFPQFETSDEYTAIYEPMAGLVDAAMGNAVHVQLARAHGATVIENCPVQRIEKMSDGWIKVIIYNLNIQMILQSEFKISKPTYLCRKIAQ